MNYQSPGKDFPGFFCGIKGVRGISSGRDNHNLSQKIRYREYPTYMPGDMLIA